MRNRRTAGVALFGAAGLLLSSFVATGSPAQAAALSITATPHVVVDGQTISVKGNAGKQNAPTLYVAVCAATPTASNCDQSLAGFGTPNAHILQVKPNASTGAWGPVKLKVRQKLFTGDNPEGGAPFDCKAAGTCVVGTTNAANPKDHTYNVTTKLTFVSGKLKATAKPKTTGKFKVGKKVKATKGTWSPAATSYKYQWLRDGKKIKKATKVKYKLKKADQGKKVSVRVTASTPGWAAGTAKSKAKKVKQR